MGDQKYEVPSFNEANVDLTAPTAPARWWQFQISYPSLLLGAILFAILILISMISGTTFSRWTSHDVNFVLSRDQVIKLAHDEPGCRQFNDEYAKFRLVTITPSQAVADERGGIYQNSFFQFGIPEVGSMEQTWRVTIATNYLQTNWNTIPGFLFDKKQIVLCDLLK